jgi:hypothetical protein
MTGLRTEDVGKIFEKAICITYDIAFDGKFKYSVEDATSLSSRLAKLPTLFPMCTHTGKRGARYDFTAFDGQHLSSKTSKARSGKVAPQVIGQAKPEKFCDILEIPFTTIPDLKKYIQTEFVHVLPIMMEYTFDCPNVYYNKGENTIQFITLASTIPWHEFEYVWTCDWSSWNNSSTLKLKTIRGDVAIVEFQFHSKSRTNMAVRWHYDNLITHFKDHFEITLL